MTYAEASNVPSDEVAWIVRRGDYAPPGLVRARLWFEARAKAVLEYGTDIIVERTSEPPASIPLTPRKLPRKK
jgi:hypothetical protein